MQGAVRLPRRFKFTVLGRSHITFFVDAPACLLICSMRRLNSAAVRACGFEAFACFPRHPAVQTKSHFRRRTRLERQSLICSPFEFRGGSHLRFLGVRLFFGPPGYTNGIACSSTHPLERPPLICSPFEFATVQVYGCWVFPCFSHDPAILTASHLRRRSRLCDQC